MIFTRQLKFMSLWIRVRTIEVWISKGLLLPITNVFNTVERDLCFYHCVAIVILQQFVKFLHKKNNVIAEVQTNTLIHTTTVEPLLADTPLQRTPSL